MARETGSRSLGRLIPAILLLLSSCNSDIVFLESGNMPDRIWKLENEQLFRVMVDDTVSTNNISFTIRTASSYPYRNIYLFVTTYSPDGKSITDTLEYYLADEKGDWFGKGIGDVHELNLNYKSNVYFPLQGIYQFKIQHGMRLEDLNGVYDMGLRIEKNSKQPLASGKE